MRFVLDDEQRGFAGSLDDLLTAADTPSVARAWAAGEPGAGQKLWSRLADLGVTGLTVPEADGGLGAGPVELCVAFEALGRHAVPGPWVETALATTLAVALEGLDGRASLLEDLATGRANATVAVPPTTPYALDADSSTHVLLLDRGILRRAAPAAAVGSVDTVRRLFRTSPGAPLADVPADVVSVATDTAVLACSAQLLGLGERLLATSVDYVKQRRQFGRPVGEYQALKHALADVRIALDFARPHLWNAALALGARDAGPRHTVPRDVSSAKVVCSDAAYRAARTALQVHGAIGYTAEHDLSLWLLKVRALVGAWGTAGEHRARILATLLAPSDRREED